VTLHKIHIGELEKITLVSGDLIQVARHGEWKSTAVEELTKAINTSSKGVSVPNPSANEDITLFNADHDFSIMMIKVVVIGDTSPSLTWTLRHAADRSAVGTEVITGGTTSTNTANGELINAVDMNSTAIVRNEWLWFETTAQAGNVEEIHITIYFAIATV